MDEKRDRLTDDELSCATGGVNVSKYIDPLYAVGTKLQKRNATSSYGSVIHRKYEDGQWIYTIMGSDLRPTEAKEKELEPKSR